jgi:hypothetical protein
MRGGREAGGRLEGALDSAEGLGELAVDALLDLALERALKERQLDLVVLVGL